MINNQEIIDDEIDIKPYIVTILKNYKLYILAIFVAFGLAFILNKTLTKQYHATTTFIIPSSSKSNMLIPNPLNAIFSQSFSSQQQSIYVDYIPVIINSYLIKTYVASRVIQDAYFDEDVHFNKLDEDEQVGYVIGKLRLSKKLALDQDLQTNLFTLKYSNQDPTLILPILKYYLEAIVIFNEKLNIDAERVQIIQIDAAKIPENHYFPKIDKLFIFSLVILWVLISVALIIYKIVSLNSKHYKLKS